MVIDAVKYYFYGEQEKIKKEEYKRWYRNNYDDMRKIVSSLLKGRDVALDENQIKHIDPAPLWLDRNEIKKGQKFAQDYFFLVSMSELLSLYLLFAVDNIIRPLIFTNKSSAVKTAMKRYFSTTLRVLSWYQTDIMDEESEARRNISAVNQMHTGVLSQMQSKSEDEVRSKCQLKNRIKEEIWSSGCPIIKEDLMEMSKRDTMDVKDGLDSTNYINQYTMALTQYAFVAQTVLHSEKQGVSLTQEDKASFIYLWRYIGYLLGIQDKYNICIGTYEEVVFKLKALTELIYKPNLARVTPEWEHMAHSACEGTNMIIDDFIFESTVVLLLEIMDLDCNQYFKSISFRAKFKYYYYKFLAFMVQFQFFRNFMNSYILNKIDAAKIKYPVKLY